MDSGSDIPQHHPDEGPPPPPQSRGWRTFSEAVHGHKSLPFKSSQRQGFLADCPAEARIVDVEKHMTKRLNPLLYTLEIAHGDFVWSVRRRFHHFRRLNTALVMSRGGGKNKTNKTATTASMAYTTEIGHQMRQAPNLLGVKSGDRSYLHEEREKRRRDSSVSSFSAAEDVSTSTEDDDDDDDKAKTAIGGDKRPKKIKATRKKRKRRRLPKFPMKPDGMLNSDELDGRRKHLEQYINAVLNDNKYRNNQEALEFFEVSEYSFVFGTAKMKEGTVKKRVGEDVGGCCPFLPQSLKINQCRGNCFFCCGGRYKKIWLIIHESCIIGVGPKSGHIRTVLLFDKDFEASSGLRQTRQRHSVLISNLSRGFCFRAWTGRKTKEWLEGIQNVISGDPAIALPEDLAKSFLQSNRFGSYAPVRYDQEAFWYADGEDFMTSVADVLEAAKEEIFITDWWLSPEIYLKRGDQFSQSSRLDSILHRKASEGVKIFILLYKEFELALGLNSFYSKRALVSKGGRDKNIKVFRHPDHKGPTVDDFLWAHHEKLVVVDQSYAFVGGIDLCYGRWDKNSHPLTDLDKKTDAPPNCNIDQPDRAAAGSNKTGLIGSSSTAASGPKLMVPNTSSRQAEGRAGGGLVIQHILRSAHEVTVAPVRAASNETLDNEAADHGQKSAPDDDNGERRTKNASLEADAKGGGRKRSKMKRKLKGAINKAKERLDRKDQTSSSSSSSSSSDSDDDAYGTPAEDGKSSEEENEDEDLRRITNPALASDADMTEALKKESKSKKCNNNNKEYLWKGKDYVNFIVKDVANPDDPEGDNVDRRTTPRMPWHDIATGVQGAAARDVARHFIQRWNAVKSEKAKFNSDYPFLVPKSYVDVYDIDREVFSRRKGQRRGSTVNCQVLRSVSSWSAGVDDIEASIHEAMCKAILAAEKFVYIENQFFITSCASTGADVKNGIGNAMLQRIKRAHTEKKRFRVFVLLPLLPAFEGKVGSATGNALRTILHYQFASICRGEHSLLTQLSKMNINPNEYISFCGLRTHGHLLGTPVTELVYIHSKLTIVDDRVVICGSANINDRSLLGNRDSEVALMFEDIEFDESGSGKFAGSMRRALMAEHLGIRDESHDGVLADPTEEKFYKDVWLRTAAINTKLFDDAFMVVPTDKVTNMDKCHEYEQRTPLAEFDRGAANRILKGVKGNLVLIPLRFLEDENLAPPVFAKEGLVPSMTWT